MVLHHGITWYGICCTKAAVVILRDWSDNNWSALLRFIGLLWDIWTKNRLQSGIGPLQY